MMSSFGQLLRKLRRQCRDPQRGGMLTQERFGELIGDVVGDRGYSGAAVSDWERDKSKIHQDDRLVLNAIIQVFQQCGAIEEAGKADELLISGNYRPLNQEERRLLFPGQGAKPFTKDEAADTVSEALSATQGAKIIPARRRKQLILLEKVKNFWVEGVLNKSLENAPKLNLELVSRHALVDWPWAEHFGDEFKESGVYTSDQILDAYLRADRALLILGRPGAGKTMTLIRLADQLIGRALATSDEPIPVILNLSSWAKRMQPLADWIVEELTLKYQIPGQYGREWLQNDELVLLLDGYDHLHFEGRTHLADAINAFRQKHGLSGLAVCSRIEEYIQIPARLRLGGAVEILSLSMEKIEAYFQSLGVQGQTVYAELNRSRSLRQIARSPLMLGILWAVYRPQNSGEDRQEFTEIEGKDGDLESLNQSYLSLFTTYIRRMFSQPLPESDQDAGKTIDLLSWLARRLNEHNQTVLLIEQIQPSWLPRRNWRFIYMILSGIFLGTMGGFIMWLLWQLLRLTLPQLPAFTSERLANLLNIAHGLGEGLTILGGNVLLGLITALVLTVLYERRVTNVQPYNRNAYRLQQIILVGIFTGLPTLIVVYWSSGLLLAVAWCVAETFMYMAAARFAFGWNYQEDVRTVEALGWSWRHALNGLFMGIFLAVVAEAIESALYGYNGLARTFLTLALAGFTLGGLRGRLIRQKSHPNQGIWLSMRNALLAAVLVALPLSAVSWFLRDPLYALVIGLLSGIIAISILGGSNVVKHFLLRFLLHWSVGLPWRFARFLDSAARLTFLRKVGGGYIFMHNLLQDYFANLRN